MHSIVGRENELEVLKKQLSRAMTKNGSTTIISGEAGIGKTRLVDEFRKYAEENNVTMLSGQGAMDAVHPFLIFTQALDTRDSDPIFLENEYTFFNGVFAINRGGLLIGQASPETQDLDADIFAGMLSAVQNFVADSFDASGAMEAGLGRLEYGNMKIIIKHGQHLFLTGIFEGAEHPDMEMMLKRTVDRIENQYGQMLESWSGNMSQVHGVQDEIEAVSNAKFLVRRDLEGVKLENERLRIANLVYERLAAMSKERPLLLLLRDLHWADESSLFVLNYLARNIKDQNIMIVGTCRPDESNSLKVTITKMHEEELINDIVLEKLGPEEIIRLIDTVISPNNFPEEFLKKISSQCEGNPFFITEMLRHMMAEDCIIMEDGKYTITEAEYSIPGTVEEVVHRRLDKLEPDAMAMVEYMACIGREFNCNIANSIPSLKDSSQAMGKLQGMGIIEISGDNASFTHALFHDITYQSIGNRWKNTYHKSIGEHYESDYSGILGEVIYELASQFSRSNEFQKAYDYSIQAGEKAEMSYAPEQAVIFYGNSLNALDKLKLGTDSQDKNIQILERLGDLEELMGDSDNAICTFKKIEELAKDNTVRARAIRKQAKILETKGDYDLGIKFVDRAKNILSNESCTEFGRILNTEGSIYERKGEYDKSIETQNMALELLKKHDAPKKDLASIYNSIGTSFWGKNDFTSALDNYMKGLDIHQEMDDYRGLASSYNNIGIVYTRKGDYNKASQFIEKSLEMYEISGDKNGLASASGNLGNVYMAKGNNKLAEEAYMKCYNAFKKIGNRWAAGVSEASLGSIYQYRGEFEKALDYYQKSLNNRGAVGDKRGIGVVTHNMGALFYDMGEYEKSREHQLKAISIISDIGDDSIQTHAMVALARTDIKLGNLAEAKQNTQIALDISREKDLKENEMVALTAWGVVAAEEEDWAEAESSFQDCIDYSEKEGYKKMSAEAYLELGRMFRKKNEPEKAIQPLEKALELYNEMSQPLLIKEVKEELELARKN
ncbi:MAG: tetratricopeptide repeat protein [Thermoplasmata archaeon]|nr:tetratricopeptide repeat protein [Thermoplasmata archaeon]